MADDIPLVDLVTGVPIVDSTTGIPVVATNASNCICCSNCSAYCVNFFTSNVNCSTGFASSCNWSSPTFSSTSLYTPDALADLLAQYPQEQWNLVAPLGLCVGTINQSTGMFEIIQCDDPDPCTAIWFNYSCASLNVSSGKYDICPSVGTPSTPTLPIPVSPLDPSQAMCKDATCDDWTAYWQQSQGSLLVNLTGLQDGGNTFGCPSAANGLYGVSWSAAGPPVLAGQGYANFPNSWNGTKYNTPSQSCTGTVNALQIAIHCIGQDMVSGLDIWQADLDIPCGENLPSGIGYGPFITMTFQRTARAPFTSFIGAPFSTPWVLANINDASYNTPPFGPPVNTLTSGISLIVSY